MSWSARFEKVRGCSGLREELVPERASCGPACELWEAEIREQFDAAADAAVAVIASGAVGKASGEFCVFLSGHANPGHTPAVGWSNDCVSVNVTQL